MRWFQLLGGNKQQVAQDPARQAAMLQDVRHRFGAHQQVRFADQVAAIARLLDGDDDGLAVAAHILREFADEAETALLAQAYDLHRRTGRRVVVDRRTYRPLWQAAGWELRWPLFVLPGGLHPYVQVAAAVHVVGAQAPRVALVTDPYPLLTHVFEVLDLLAVGWEYARVRVDTDAAALAHGLIAAARQIRATMEEPPPLPPPARELMRRNNTLEVYDPAGNRVVGGINLGAEMRPALLV